jgi:hypothetical protein
MKRRCGLIVVLAACLVLTDLGWVGGQLLELRKDPTLCDDPENSRDCARNCESETECRQCCQEFASGARQSCLDRCDEVWRD